MQKLLSFVLLFAAAEGLRLQQHSDTQCKEARASLHEATPRCNEICSQKVAFHAKLQAPKQYACASFWYDNFETDKACEENTEQVHADMMNFLCGDSGICHEAEEPKDTKTKGLVFTAPQGHWELVKKTLTVLPKLQKDRPLGTEFELKTLPAEIMVDNAGLLEQCQEFFGNLAKCFASKKNPQEWMQLGERGRYGYKPAAILESSFDEVLFLDDDVVPVRDPTGLFESCEYKKTGALLMPDLFGHACAERYDSLMGQAAWPEHAMYQVANVTWEPKWAHAQEMESGFILVDKTRHLKALKLTQHFTESAAAQKMIYGDKDMWKFAYLALGSSYGLTSDRPTQLMMQSEENPAQYRRIGEVQRMMGVNMFTHHIPRPLDLTVIEGGLNTLNPLQAVALAVATDTQGKNGYSYCPPTFAHFTAAGLKESNYEMACFPKEGAPCPEKEFGKPEGVLQDAVEAIQYLAKNNF